MYETTFGLSVIKEAYQVIEGRKERQGADRAAHILRVLT